MPRYRFYTGTAHRCYVSQVLLFWTFLFARFPHENHSLQPFHYILQSLKPAICNNSNWNCTSFFWKKTDTEKRKKGIITHICSSLDSSVIRFAHVIEKRKNSFSHLTIQYCTLESPDLALPSNKCLNQKAKTLLVDHQSMPRYVFEIHQCKVLVFPQSFTVPPEFPDTLRTLVREILRNQPQSGHEINKFGMLANELYHLI